ncbi:MAG: hypothetical protein ABI790_01260 [Betaproteobacteria bacterium]
MKTAFTLNSRSNKDNVATATLLAIGLFAVASGLFTSRPAEANFVAMDVQTLEPIVVTAPRVTHTTLDTIVVTAPRIASVS